MHKDDAKKKVEEFIKENESLVGFFSAQQRPSMWYALISGPLVALLTKSYFVGVTNKGLHLHKLSAMGGFKDHRFVPFDEIARVEFGCGNIQRTVELSLKDGTDILLRAQISGLERVAKLNDDTQAYIAGSIA